MGEQYISPKEKGPKRKSLKFRRKLSVKVSIVWHALCRYAGILINLNWGGNSIKSGMVKAFTFLMMVLLAACAGAAGSGDDSSSGGSSSGLGPTITYPPTFGDHGPPIDMSLYSLKVIFVCPAEVATDPNGGSTSQTYQIVLSTMNCDLDDLDTYLNWGTPLGSQLAAQAGVEDDNSNPDPAPSSQWLTNRINDRCHFRFYNNLHSPQVIFPDILRNTGDVNCVVNNGPFQPWQPQGPRDDCYFEPHDDDFCEDHSWIQTGNSWGS
jgi:hypothetical protein